MDPRRKLYLGLRKRTRVQRRFSVEHAGGDKVRWTCLTCGWSKVDRCPHPSPARYVLYVMGAEGNGSGCGTCERCTKVERDRRYPLPRAAK